MTPTMAVIVAALAVALAEIAGVAVRALVRRR
jgi:hypothetical protein